jgi:acetate kinase
MEAAPLQGKTELIEKMAERAEQQQMQQQKMDEAEQIQKALEMSQIDQNTALAEERRARVLADIGLARERISEGEQNYARALLDNAKTVNEIKDMDRKRLLDVMELAADISQKQATLTEKKLTMDAQKAKSPLTTGD